MRVGDTAVVCGVRAEILLAKDVTDARRVTPTYTSPIHGEIDQHESKRRKLKADSQEIASLNLLVPNLELATGCSPAHLPGGPPSTLAQTLSQRLLTLLHTPGLVRMDELRILHRRVAEGTGNDEMEDDDGEIEEEQEEEVKAYWTLYIDILFISLDGNPFDAALGAMLAALADTTLPKASWDIDKELILCDPSPSHGRRLNLAHNLNEIPIALTFGVFEGGKAGGKWILADMDGFEEGVCEERVTVVVKGDVMEEAMMERGKAECAVLSIEKVGGIGIGRGEMRELVRMAESRWRDWRQILRKVVG